MENCPLDQFLSENCTENLLLNDKYTEEIAIKLSGIIYDSVEEKNNQNTERRLSLLKCVEEVCDYRPHMHLDVNSKNVRIFVDFLESQFQPDFHVEKPDYHHDIQEFYTLKTSKTFTKHQYTDFFSGIDWEKCDFENELTQDLNASLPVYGSLSCDCSSRMLLIETPKISKRSQEFRKYQIHFGVSLLHLNIDSAERIIAQILDQFECYCNNFYQFEMDFFLSLLYFDYYDLLLQKVPNSMNIYLLRYCEKILKLMCIDDVNDFFKDLHNDVNVRIVQNTCKKCPVFLDKILNFLYDVYIKTYCNTNVLRFRECFQ